MFNNQLKGLNAQMVVKSMRAVIQQKILRINVHFLEKSLQMMVRSQ